MTELEQYYNEAFKKKGMTEFQNLPEKKIRALENSLGFATWKVGKAKQHFDKTLSDNLPSVKRLFRLPF